MLKNIILIKKYLYTTLDNITRYTLKAKEDGLVDA